MGITNRRGSFFHCFSLVISGIVMSCGSTLSAEQPSQSFSVSVPVESSVQPPPDVAIIHDLTDGEQQFSPQSWTVGSNSMTGMVVDFTVASGFVHNTDPTSKSNAILSVGVASSNGPANWVASKPADRTDVTVGDETASVRVESDNVGSAKVNLNVGFDDSDQFEALPGVYETTVVATLTLP
ncbi:hypothetical protein [Rubripirellula obstinata]|nr:hypothetical protein [Rubripirellula obstinata]